MQVADGIHLLTKGVVNFYLVEDGGKLTLIDAGAPGDWDVFARAVASLGRTLEDLDDALAMRNPLTGRTGPQIAPDGLNRDSDLALGSLDALAPLPADLVLPGHGEPFTDGIAVAVRLAKLAGRT